MTMPHLMNCSHSCEGWCLDCVKQLHDAKEVSDRRLETYVRINLDTQLRTRLAVGAAPECSGKKYGYYWDRVYAGTLIQAIDVAANELLGPGPTSTGII